MYRKTNKTRSWVEVVCTTNRHIYRNTSPYKWEREAQTNTRGRIYTKRISILLLLLYTSVARYECPLHWNLFFFLFGPAKREPRDSVNHCRLLFLYIEKKICFKIDNGWFCLNLPYCWGIPVTSLAVNATTNNRQQIFILKVRLLSNEWNLNFLEKKLKQNLLYIQKNKRAIKPTPAYISVCTFRTFMRVQANLNNQYGFWETLQRLGS